MAMISVIADLDRCKIALQYVAEMHSDSLTTVLELLLERLEDAIGQADAHLRQCTCQGHAPQSAPSVPGHSGVLTVLPPRQQRPRRPAPEELYDEEECEDSL
jgi:hypothetical protein